MNGRTHAAIGAASAVALLASTSPQNAVPAAVIAAGTALFPDLDHPDSTASKALPGVPVVVRALARSARVASSTRADREYAAWQEGVGHDPDHRTLTHTLLSGAAFAAVVLLLCTAAPLAGFVLVAVCAWVCRGLAPRSVWWLAALACAVVFSVMAAPAPQLVALAAGAGWLSHVLADGCTKAGVPLFWPLAVRGKRWWRVRFLGRWIASGDPREWIPGIVIAVVMSAPFVLVSVLY